MAVRQAVDFDPEFWSPFEECRFATMAFAERLYVIYKAIGYLNRIKNKVALFECSVWRGGSVMVMAESPKLDRKSDRSIVL